MAVFLQRMVSVAPAFTNTITRTTRRERMEERYMSNPSERVNLTHHCIENNQVVWLLLCGYSMRMKLRYLAMLAAALLVSPLQAFAQTPNIVGTWVLTAADKLLPDGTRTSDYGENPHGLAIFTADGHYAVEIYRADRPKLSSNDRSKASQEEYKGVALGMSVH